MSVALYNRKGNSYSISEREWFHLLELAQAYGWKPTGTKPPTGWTSEHSWNSEDYYSTFSQYVSKEDARNLIAALEKTIPNLRKPKKKQKKEDEIWANRIQLWKRVDWYLNPSDTGTLDPAIMGFHLENIEYITRFISFCHQGEFQIGRSTERGN